MPSPPRFIRAFYTHTLLLPFLLFFTKTLSEQLLEVPVVRLVEKAICERFYLNTPNGDINLINDIDESHCKIPEVQNMLSMVIGWHKSFVAAPGLLAFFFGLLASRYGRRLVTSLSITGMLCASIVFFLICISNTIFPVQLVWLSSLCLCLGGGTTVFDAMTFAMVADASLPSSKTISLLLLVAVHHVTRFVFPPVTSLIMSHSLQLPFFLAFGVLAFGALSAWIGTVMEAEAQVMPQFQENQETEVGEEPGPLTEESDTSSSAPLIFKAHSPLPAVAPFQTWTSIYHSALETASLFLQNPYLLFVLFTILAKKIAFSAEGFMFQYASERFGWELRKTTIFRSTNAAGATMATLVLWPMVITLIAGTRYPKTKLDMVIIRTSLFIGMLSFFASWEATSGLALAVAMFGAGAVEGLHPTLQGSIASIFPDTAQIFTVLGTAETIGGFISGPIMSRLVAIGRTPSTPSSGVLFLVSGAIFGVLFIWACFVAPFYKQRDVIDTQRSD